MWWPFGRKKKAKAEEPRKAPYAARPRLRETPRAPVRAPEPEPEPSLPFDDAPEGAVEAPEALAPAALHATPAPRTADDILRQLEAERAEREEAAPAAPVDPALGRHLLAEGPLTREFIEQQIALSGKGDDYLCRILRGLPAPTEQRLFAVLGAGYRIPDVDLRQCRVLTTIARAIPADVALKYKIAPIERVGDLLCVVFAGEPNPKAIEAVRRASGLRVKALRCPAHHVDILLRRLYRHQQVVSATPLSEREYESLARGPQARWESVHLSKGPIRAERLG